MASLSVDDTNHKGAAGRLDSSVLAGSGLV